MFVGGSGTNTTANLLAMFKNSFIVSIAVTVGALIITSLSAYAYERLDFKGGNAIFSTSAGFHAETIMRRESG